MSAATRHGYLLLADISGYTSFVAGTELEHSHRRATTCTCNACRSIPSLDLKFIAHHGDYVVQQVRDIRELVGSDVNLVHRLLKNHVTESTGWRAYTLLTESCLEHLQLSLEGASVQIEEYEHLGQVKTHVLDLHKHYQEITDERRVMIEEKDADFATVHFSRKKTLKVFFENLKFTKGKEMSPRRHATPLGFGCTVEKCG